VGVQHRRLNAISAAWQTRPASIAPTAEQNTKSFGLKPRRHMISHWPVLAAAAPFTIAKATSRWSISVSMTALTDLTIGSPNSKAVLQRSNNAGRTRSENSAHVHAADDLSWKDAEGRRCYAQQYTNEDLTPEAARRGPLRISAVVPGTEEKLGRWSQSAADRNTALEETLEELRAVIRA